jgi:hypothetical protein
MQTVRFMAAPIWAAVAAVLIASLALPDVFAAVDASPHGYAVAQGFEKLPSFVAPTPYAPNSQSSTSPSGSSKPDHNQDTSDRDRSISDRDPSASSEGAWGAIAFTADGSYSSTWKMPSQPEAEAKVLRQCARFGRGGCEVVSFSGQQCAALATFIGGYKRRRWNLSFTAGGLTYPSAQSAAMERCNTDERTQGRCQPRTTACADGR